MTTHRQTRRWRGVAAVALGLAAIGVVAGRASVIMLAIVGVAFATYPELSTPPQVNLDLEREISEDTPDHDEDVEVTVRIRNVGENTLADLRIVEGVPPMLEVTGGTARHAATLRPGAETTFTYTVRAVEGTHHFEPATAIARDIAGTTEVVTTVAGDTTTLEVLSEVPDVPLRRQTHQFVGEIATDEGGVGVEFFQTREYNKGDALARVNWNRYAKTGELSTIEFRKERGAAVVLCVDAREPAYRTAAADTPNGVAYAHTAARELLDAMSNSSHTVGLASLSDREACWLGVGAGDEHLDRARQLLVMDASLSKYPPEAAERARWDEQLTTLRARLPSEAQVVLLSPLTDAFAVEAALTLEASGHAVTVISPDVSADETVGERAARAQRNNNIFSLRGSGVRVVDWPPEEPLGAVLMRTQERWSK